MCCSRSLNKPACAIHGHGLDLLRSLRANGTTASSLSAQSQIDRVLLGLELGAAAPALSWPHG